MKGTYNQLSIVKKISDQVSCDMAGEAIVLNLKSGVYFGMDEVGALIWSLLEKPRTIGEIRDAILEEYDVDSDSCDRDLMSFLDSLQTAGLVEIDNDTTA